LAGMADPRVRGGTYYEFQVTDAHCVALGMDRDPQRRVVPWRALSRALSDQPGSAGGYAVNGAGPHDQLAAMLAPFSVVVEAGATVLEAEGSGPVQIPVHKTAATGTWIGPGVTVTPSTMPLGALSLTPRTNLSLLDFSIQLERQGGALADRAISIALMQSAGAAKDTGVFSGAGGVELLGITNRSDIASTSGSALAWSGICAMRKAVMNAGARESLMSTSKKKTAAARTRQGSAARSDAITAGSRARATQHCLSYRC